MTSPKDSGLIRAAFDKPSGKPSERLQVWVERDGVTTVGKRPEWLDWPMVRGDEMGPAYTPPKAKGRK